MLNPSAPGTEPAPAGEKYEELSYAANMTVFVPEKCPCCGE